MILNWHDVFGIVSSGILILLVYPYARTMLTGTTRPNVVTWLGWCFLGAIATALQISEGASWSVVVPLLTTLNTAIIAVFAIWLGYARITKVEIICIALGVLSLLLWLVAQAPLLSLLLITLADLFITIPTFIKTYQAPETEPPLLWALYTIGAGLGIIATREYDIFNLFYPSYIAIGALIIALLALRGKVKKYRV